MALRFVGIDLGTTTSTVSACDADGKPRLLASKGGKPALPSVVSFVSGAGPPTVLVGAPAKRRAATHPTATVLGAKRLLGRRFDDPEIERLAAGLAQAVVPSPKGEACLEVDGRALSPEEITAHLLAHLRHVAEEQLGPGGLGAVVAVPACFDAAQRRAAQRAVEAAGFATCRLLGAPVAAALGAGQGKERRARVAVCDLGGGVLDVAILEIENGVFEVRGAQGDSLVGGDDFDRLIVARLAAEVRAQQGVDVLEDAALYTRLREAAQDAKHSLSQVSQAQMRVAEIGGGGFTRALTRAELEVWVRELVDRLEAPCRGALAAAGLAAGQLDQLVLVGGATRMPCVQRRLQEIFGLPPQRSIHPDEAVPLGAALHAAQLGADDTSRALLEVSPRAYGLHAGGGRFVPLVPVGAGLPAREERLIATTHDGQRELTVGVYESDGRSLGCHLETLTVQDLPAAPAGQAMVLVELSVDIDGLPHAAARSLVR